MQVTRKSSLAPLRGKSIGIIGYGSQGRAQALNLRDAGFHPIIGLPAQSRSRTVARRDRMRVCSVDELLAVSDVVFLLAPDHLHGRILDRRRTVLLRAGQCFVFAHASSVHFGLVTLPRFVDVILIAPMGPGARLRELRGRPDGVACFFAIRQNPSGRVRALGLALAKAIGCIPAGAIDTTFAEEATGDLFGEQAVLCGGLSALLQAGVDTLVRHGARPSHAYLECVHQIDLIVDLIKRDGLRGMFKQISPTAAYGAAVAGPRIISPAVKRTMDTIYRDISSGRFMKRWIHASQRPTAGEFSPTYLRGETEVLKALSTKKP